MKLHPQTDLYIKAGNVVLKQNKIVNQILSCGYTLEWSWLDISNEYTHNTGMDFSLSFSTVLNPLLLNL